LPFALTNFVFAPFRTTFPEMYFLGGFFGNDSRIDVISGLGWLKQANNPARKPQRTADWQIVVLLLVVIST
jgi:hypothetical protein